MIRAMMEMEVVTMVAVHALTMMHSAHNLIIIRIFDHQDDSFIFDTTKWPTFK